MVFSGFFVTYRGFERTFDERLAAQGAVRAPVGSWDNGPVPPSSIWPILHYLQASHAVRYLVNVLGFELVMIVYGRGGAVAHAELGWPGGGVVVVGSATHESRESEGIPPGQSAQYLVAQEIDVAFDRVSGAGGDIVEPPHEVRVGPGRRAQMFTVRDPEGNLWTLGDHPGIAVAL